MKEKRNHRGEQRRAAILARLRAEGPAYHADLARAVGLATHRSFSPTLEGHLAILEAEGRVQQVGRKWVPA